jgi:hypothetical protein
MGPAFPTIYAPVGHICHVVGMIEAESNPDQVKR